MDILFVVDKWCHGLPKNGVSAWESNFVNSYRTVFPKNDVGEFNFDVYRETLTTPIPANQALLNTIEDKRPKYIFIVIYEMPSLSDRIISFPTFEKIKDMRIPIITIFGDLEHALQCDIAKKIESYCSLIFYSALALPGRRLKLLKSKYTWVPKDPAIFFNEDSGTDRDIGISYLGSPKADRISRINFLKRHGLDIFSTGGERQVNIPNTEYGRLLRRSKISLGFSRANGNHVTNARTFEVISCGAMLIEEEGMETLKLFQPYIDYIPFFGRYDLLDKCKYYLANDEARRTIASSAQERLNRLFSAKRFWDEIEEYVNKHSTSILNMRKPVNPLGYTDYWEQDLDLRSSPSLKDGYTQRLSAKVRLKYFILDFIGSSPFLNYLHKTLIVISQIPNRIIMKIYFLYFKK